MSLNLLSNKSIINKPNRSNIHAINRLKWRPQTTSWSSSNPNIVNQPSTKLIITSCTMTHKLKAHPTTTPSATSSECEKLPKGWFWFRKWHSEDVASVSWFIAIHVLAACAPFMFDWGAFLVALGLGFLTGFGVTLGYHRLLCHRSFKVPKWLEYFFVYFGVHAFQVWSCLLLLMLVNM